VFAAADGASSGTAIYDTKTDTREVTIYNNQLYIGVDSKLNGGGGIYNFGNTLPTGQTAPVQLPGIGASIVLTAAEANVVNSASVGASVNLSPEQYFFANATTLYVADGGDPKEGGLGDGGLQKWSLVNNSWTLDYTLSAGLNMIPDTQASGTTGLVGLTGTVEGSSVVLYATNETVAETDPTFLYAITDNLAATTAPSGESFTLLETAAPGTLIRGVAFAPSTTASVPQVTSALVISAGVSSGGLTIAAPGSVTVLNGGTINGFTVLSGTFETISAGGIEANTFLAHGATGTVAGTATGDTIDGIQTVATSGAVVSNEVVENGGSIVLAGKGTTATGTTVNSGGSLIVATQAVASSTVISGGAVLLESAKATISGGLTFSGTGGKLIETVVVASGFGDQATISNFGTTDVIDLASAGSAASLSTTVSGGNVIATVTSGTFSEAFTFAGSGGVSGSAYASNLSVTSDGAGGQEIIYTPPPPVVIIVSATVTSSALTITSGNSIQVLSGGTMSGITVAAGASATISAGGVDSGSTIQAGGFETVSGSATGDQIYGTQLVTSGPSGGTLPALVSNETVFNGGTLELYLKPDIATGITVSSGGTLLLSGNVSATNTTLEAGASMTLQSPKATISGSLVFNGAATLAFTTLTSAGFGAYASATASTGATFAVISGFGAGDVIDETLVGVTSATVSSVTSGGDTFETITGGTYPQTFVFSGTAIAGHITEATDAGGGVELVYTACFATGTRLLTPDGERPVEMLHEGDWLTKADGSVAPVIWAGQRRIDLRAHTRPDAVQPVRLRAGALANGIPSRDLIVSPDHAFLLDGHLIPAKALLNGVTIAQLDWDAVTYHHVELAEHSVILAEGAAAESYLDTGNRHDFEDGPVLSLHPTFNQQRREAGSCAPFAEQGPVVEQVRATLLARAAIPLTNDAAVTLEHTADGVIIRSRVAVPGHVTADPRDRRVLGVKIAALEADGCPISLDHPALVTGWHEPEPDGRWTNGAAIVPAGLVGSAHSVRITIAATQSYPLEAVSPCGLRARQC
jgi:autotransporter passenger strand-loop-strand repeat protein